MKNNKKISMEELSQDAKNALKDRGVTLDDIADIVYFLQNNYLNDLTMDDCRESVERVLTKREVCHAVLTAIALDKAAEKDQIDEPLLSIIKDDDGLFGIDEIIPLSIVNLYGSIGLTNFGYLDRVKTGVIGELDSQTDQVNTFIDDIVAAIAASASARLGHKQRD